MFLPFPLFFQSFSQTPIVWLLLAMNIFGFLNMVEKKSVLNKESFLFEPQIMIYIGESYYDQYLAQKNERNDFGSAGLTKTQKIWMGVQALKDQKFLADFEMLVLSSDPIVQKKIVTEIKKLKEEQIKRPSYSLGLFPGSNWKSYLTYQLTHADFLHLLSNMVFLLGVGFIIEVYIGSLGLALLYFLCGAFGGGLFLLFNPHSFMPMVGASGSISGLLIFYALIEKRKNIRYAFFLSPLNEHHGFIYAPKWWIFVFFLFTDLAQVIATPAGVSTGVAYSAHLGGAIMGIVLAALWNFFLDRSEASSQSVLRDSNGL